MPLLKDMNGQKCGNLTVIAFDSICKKSRQGLWRCRCICGKEKVIQGKNLRTGVSKTCGCRTGLSLAWKPKAAINRVCRICGIDKDISEFTFSSTRREYSTRCEECRRTRNKKLAEYKADWNKEEKQRKANIRAAAIRHYGGRCVCCGEETPVFLAFDHINGGGNQHKGEIMRQKFASIGEWLKANDYPKGFQILCNNCNWAKHAKKLCPHQMDRAISFLSFGS